MLKEQLSQAEMDVPNEWEMDPEIDGLIHNFVQLNLTRELIEKKGEGALILHMTGDGGTEISLYENVLKGRYYPYKDNSDTEIQGYEESFFTLLKEIQDIVIYNKALCFRECYRKHIIAGLSNPLVAYFAIMRQIGKVNRKEGKALGKD